MIDSLYELLQILTASVILCIYFDIKNKRRIAEEEKKWGKRRDY